MPNARFEILRNTGCGGGGGGAACGAAGCGGGVGGGGGCGGGGHEQSIPEGSKRARRPPQYSAEGPLQGGS